MPIPINLSLTYESLDKYPRGYIYLLEREEYPQGYMRKVSRDREDLPNMDEQQQRDLVRRLNRIEGQVRGIKKMIEEGQEVASILVQLMALQKATRAAATVLVKAQTSTAIRKHVQEALASCPGACDHCDELVAIDRALDELDLDALLQAHLKVME